MGSILDTLDCYYLLLSPSAIPSSVRQYLLSLILEEATLLEALWRETEVPCKQPVSELERRYSRSMKSQMTVILADPIRAAKYTAMLLCEIPSSEKI